jgi:hypothetical protein
LFFFCDRGRGRSPHRAGLRHVQLGRVKFSDQEIREIFDPPGSYSGSRPARRRVVRALKAFGFESLALSSADFRKKSNIIQLGYEPVQVDILTSLKGLSFAHAWKRKQRAKFGQEHVYFIGLDDLIKLKKLFHRLQDKADLISLLETKNARER